MKLARWSSLVLRSDQNVADWLGQKLGLDFGFPLSAIGFAQDGRLVGAAVFNNFVGRDIEMSLYAKGVLDRRMCRVLSEMAFIKNPCVRCTAKTRRDNKSAIRALMAAGFKPEGLMRDHYDGADAVLFGMLKSECRFL